MSCPTKCTPPQCPTVAFRNRQTVTFSATDPTQVPWWFLTQHHLEFFSPHSDFSLDSPWISHIPLIMWHSELNSIWSLLHLGCKTITSPLLDIILLFMQPKTMVLFKTALLRSNSRATCISFLLLLQQISTNLETSSNTNVLSYTFVAQMSDTDLTGLRSSS